MLRARKRRPVEDADTSRPGQHTVEEIPGAGGFRFQPWTQFTRGLHPERHQWYVLGPDESVFPGAVVDVRRRAGGEPATVEVLDIVAERTVRRQDGSRVRYVIATFTAIASDR
jgi:hypothetical protein